MNYGEVCIKWVENTWQKRLNEKYAVDGMHMKVKTKQGTVAQYQILQNCNLCASRMGREMFQ